MGQRILHYRRLSLRPQYVIARVIGKSPGWLSLIEHDGLTPPQADLTKLTRVLGVDVAALTPDKRRKP